MRHSSNNYRDRPYTIVNCAMSLDAKLALPSRKPIKLSSEEDFKRVHELRNYCDGVLVGINTILMDDPKLTVKEKYIKNPKQPSRIVLDTSGRCPKNAAVFDGTAQTLIVMGAEQKPKKANFPNAESVYCKTDENGFINLDELLKTLKNKGIENLLVEGGETVIYNFLNKGLVDELYVFISNVIIGGTTAPTLAGGKGAQSPDEIIKLQLLSFERMGDGLLLKYLA